MPSCPQPQRANLGPLPDPPTASERFTQLFDAEAAAVLAYLLRRIRTPVDAADALADTFLVAWTRIDEVPTGAGARPWLFGVARMTLLNLKRGQSRRTGLAARLRAELETDRPVAGPATSAGADLLAAMSKLRDDDREVLLLVGLDGLTSEQASIVLSISPGATRLRLHRARKRLRHLLEAGESVEKRAAVVRTSNPTKGTPALPGLKEHG